jgi:hypothetical protein
MSPTDLARVTYGILLVYEEGKVVVDIERARIKVAVAVLF